jgi:hypothetical protein
MFAVQTAATHRADAQQDSIPGAQNVFVAASPAYSTVPPENSTASAMLLPPDRNGSADSARYVSSAATGDASANSRMPAGSIHKQQLPLCGVMHASGTVSWRRASHVIVC